MDKQVAISITIQKNDHKSETMLQLSLENIIPSPQGTEKIEHILTLKNSGVLTVVCMVN